MAGRLQVTRPECHCWSPALLSALPCLLLLRCTSSGTGAAGWPPLSVQTFSSLLTHCLKVSVCLGVRKAYFRERERGSVRGVQLLAVMYMLFILVRDRIFILNKIYKAILVVCIMEVWNPYVCSMCGWLLIRRKIKTAPSQSTVTCMLLLHLLQRRANVENRGDSCTRGGREW